MSHLFGKRSHIMEQTNKPLTSFPGPNPVSFWQSFLIAGVVCFFACIGALTSFLIYKAINPHFIFVPMLAIIAFISIFAREYHKISTDIFKVIAMIFYIIGVLCFVEINFFPTTKGALSAIIAKNIGTILPWGIILVWTFFSVFIFRRTLEDKETDEWAERTAKMLFGSDAEKLEQIS